MSGRRRAAAAAPALLWSLVGLALAAVMGVAALRWYYGLGFEGDNLRLAYPWALALLVALPAVSVFQGGLLRTAVPRQATSRLALLRRLGGGHRRRFAQAPLGLRLGALLLVVVALSRPQSVHARLPTEVEGIDLMMVLDMSLSMQAADINPNRFEATKQVVDAFIVRRPNDRIGAVAFGREAFTLLPLTTDKTALRNMVAGLRLGMIDGRGTAIGNACGTALNRLRRSKAKSRVLILLTDGESNSGNISPREAARIASALDVKIYSILMGQRDQAQVQRGVDLFGRPLWDRGSFPVNPELLREMAKSTGGKAFEVGNRRELERSFHAILDALEKSKIEDAGKIVADIYPAALGPALLLLLLERLVLLFWLRRWP